jgi:thiol-disulfide isomerase/thioredoxin
MLSWNRFRWPGIVLLAGLFCAALSWLAPAADDKVEKTVEKSAEKTAEKTDPFAVPNGTAEELLKYIEGLAKERPTADNREAMMEFFKKRSTAMVEAADKVLAAKPTADQAKTAVKCKVGSLQLLERLGDADAVKKLEAVPAELEKAGLKDLIPEVRGALLLSKLQRGAGMNKEDFAKVLAEVKTFLSEQKKPDRVAANLAINAAMAAEGSADTQQAIQTYEDFGKLLAKSDDKNISGMGAMMQGAARRLGLVGKEMTLEGTTVEGKPFDWSKYKGKVVLIDFFATWCGPCRAEVPNVEKNYEAYHQKGFDVVTISVDQDRKALDDYLEQNKHPWTVLHDSAEARGTDKSMSTYYGIIGIPQLILVGKDGKVVSLEARGPQLGKELEKLLGPPEKKKEDKTEEKKTAPDKK